MAETIMDRIARELGLDLDSRSARRAGALVEECYGLLDSLVAARKAAGLSIWDVAERMGVDVARVWEVEETGGNPRLSLVRRYAHAVGVRLRLEVVPDE